MHDLREFIQDVRKIVERHNTGEIGGYIRVLPDAGNENGKLTADVYGCACAANILYTINEFPIMPNEREQFIKKLQSFQNKENGLFENPGNYETHTTAFVSGALDLFDAKPLYQGYGLAGYQTKDGLNHFMEEIDWKQAPWLGSHLGAGIYASMLLTGMSTDEWEDTYFEWLDNNADPKTGLWRKGALGVADPFHYLAGTFHYVFNYEYAKRKLPYPKELLNTCINAYYDGVCMDFTKELGWADIDYSYLLARVQRRAGVQYEESQKILKEIADGLIGQLKSMDLSKAKIAMDLNTLFAIVSALAALQDALPGYIRTSKPLRLVLDKRPFL